MIARPHTTRYGWALALLAMAGLVLLTFTRAAEPPGEEPKPEPAAKSPPAGSGEESLNLLRDELNRLEAQIAALSEEKAELGLKVNSTQRSAQAVIDHLEFQQLRALAEAQEAERTLAQLKKLSATQRRQAALTILPDANLQPLWENLAETEQQLAGKISEFAAGHPEAKSLQNVVEVIHQQIDARIDGIMVGLEAKIELALERSERLRRELQDQQHSQFSNSLRRQPYLRIERELQVMQEVRDKLAKRYLEEKINAKLPASLRLRSHRETEAVEQNWPSEVGGSQ